GRREAARGEEGVAIAHADPAVDDRRVEGRRPEVLPDALDHVALDVVGRRGGVDRAGRIRADDHEAGIALLEVAGGAGDRAAGPDADDQVRDPPAALLPQLGPGRAV